MSRMNARAKSVLGAAAATGFLFAAIASSALAQGNGGAIPPLHSSVDGNGVDMMTGQFFTASPSVSIGGPAGGISYAQLIYGEDWRHSVAGTIDVDGSTYYVSIGGATETFTKSGSTFTSDQASGSTLTQDSVTEDYTYTMRDGTVALFDPDYVDYAARYANEALVTRIEAPTGERTDYFYSTAILMDWSNPMEPVFIGAAYRLSSVTNNFGYQLHFHYFSDSASTPSALDNWYRLEEVMALNNAVERCHPTTNTCSTSNSWPTLEIANAAGVHTYTDALGLETDINFSGNRINYIDYPGGVTQDIDVDYISGRVATVTDGASNSWSYSYTTGTNTQSGNPTFQTSVNGPGTDDYSFISENDSTTGDLVKTTYVDQSGESWVNEYDSQGRVKKSVAPEGNYVTYTYDGRSNLTAVVVYPTTAGTGSISQTATYPATCVHRAECNQPISTTDSAGNTTNYYYADPDTGQDSNNGQLVKIEYPVAAVQTPALPRPTIEFHYEEQAAYILDPVTGSAGYAQPISMPHYSETCAVDIPEDCTAAQRRVTEVLYEVANTSSNPPVYTNILPVTTSSCSHNSATGTTGGTYSVDIQCGAGASVRVSASTTWNRFGLPETVDGPQSGSADTTRYYYDVLGQRMEGIIGPDPDGSGGNPHRAVRFTFDATSGLPTREERGRITTQPSTSPSSWTGYTPHEAIEVDYDSLFRPIERRVIVLPNGVTETIEAVTQASYTNLSQVECVAVRMNTSQFSSLPTSACTHSTAGGHGPDRITRYTYRSTGQVQSVTSGYGTSPDVSITVDYTYWDDGLLARIDDGEGRQTAYTYDAFRRLQGIFYADPSTGIVNPNHILVFGYDSAGRQNLMVYRDDTNLNDDIFVSLQFDNLSRVTQRNVRISSNPPVDVMNAVSIEYDLLGNVIRQSLNGYTGWGQDYEATYDTLGRLSSAGYTDGGTRQNFVHYSYDEAGRRSEMNWDGTLNSVSYSYDNTGALTGIRRNDSTTVFFAEYSYDVIGRLVRTDRINGVDTTYGYDAASRLTSVSHDMNGTASDVTFNYSYNAAFQVASRVVSNDSYRYDQRSTGVLNYDIDGLNRIEDINNGTAFTYDDHGNLLTGSGETYSYDEMNRLETATGGSALSYGADGQLDAIGGSARRFTYDGANVTLEHDSGGNLAYRYVHAGGLGAPLLRLTGANNNDQRFYLTDGLGSVVATTDANGDMRYINTYDEFGVEDTANQGLFGYAGMMRLDGTGMTHNRNRAYNPEFGRFLQTDPIGQAGGLNIYAYVGADPINYVDPLGLKPDDPDVVLPPGWRGTGCKPDGEKPDGTPVERCSGAYNVLAVNQFLEAYRDMMTNLFGPVGGSRGAPVDDVITVTGRRLTNHSKQANDNHLFFQPPLTCTMRTYDCISNGPGMIEQNQHRTWCQEAETICENQVRSSMNFGVFAVLIWPDRATTFAINGQLTLVRPGVRQLPSGPFGPGSRNPWSTGPWRE